MTAALSTSRAAAAATGEPPPHSIERREGKNLSTSGLSVMQQAQAMAALISRVVRYEMLALSNVKSARVGCRTRSQRRMEEMVHTLDRHPSGGGPLVRMGEKERNLPKPEGEDAVEAYLLARPGLQVDDDREREDVEEDVGADVEGRVGVPVAGRVAMSGGVKSGLPEGAQGSAGRDDCAERPEAVGDDDDGHDGVDGVAGMLIP